MSEWVDLTQPITEDTPARPLHVSPTFADHLTHEADDTQSTLVSIETHVGTHMDAPAHFYAGEDHRTIDQVTPAEMVAEGVVCDFSDKAPNSTISGEELRERAQRYDLSAGEYVILDTGAEVADSDAYLLEYVSLDASAAEYLRDVGITCLATDALNVDQSGLSVADHVVHHTLLSADVLIVEGITGVERVSPGRVDVVCTPLPYVGRDGSQVRFLARPQ